jgi:hypothetical protein
VSQRFGGLDRNCAAAEERVARASVEPGALGRRLAFLQKWPTSVVSGRRTRIASRERDEGASPVAIPHRSRDYAGWVRVGGALLYVGLDRPSAIEATEQTEPAEAEKLLAAVRAGPAAMDAAERAVAVAEDATAEVERAKQLLQTLVERADPDTVAREARALLDRLIAMLDDSRRRDALRLARVLLAVFALMRSWREVVRVVDLARHAAQELGDAAAQAWTLHEQGTLAALVDDGAVARELLGRARDLFESIGDHASAGVSTHNLGQIAAAPPPALGTAGRAARWAAAHKAVAVAATVAGLGAAGVAYAVLTSGGARAEIVGFAAANDTRAIAVFDRTGKLPTRHADPGGTLNACRPLHLMDFVRFHDMRPRSRVEVASFVNGRQHASMSERWTGKPNRPEGHTSYVNAGNDPVAYGHWRVTVKIDGKHRATASVELKDDC